MTTVKLDRKNNAPYPKPSGSKAGFGERKGDLKISVTVQIFDLELELEAKYSRDLPRT